MALRRILSRLYDHPRVTDNIPGLTAYVRDVTQGGRACFSLEGAEYISDPHVERRGDLIFPHGGSIKDLIKETKSADGWHDDGPPRQQYRAGVRGRRVPRESWDGGEMWKDTGMVFPRAKIAPGPRPPRQQLFYPFLAHKPQGEDDNYDLVVAVNNAVPKVVGQFDFNPSFRSVGRGLHCRR